MNHLNYLIAAYLVFWVATFFYLFTIDRRQRDVHNAIRKLSDPKNEEN